MSSRSLLSVRRRGLALCQVLSLSLVAMAAQAQTATSAAPADPKAAPMSDVDRAKRDADKVFQWIKFHAEKGEARKAAENKAAEKQHEAKAEPPKPAAAPAPASKPAAVAAATPPVAPAPAAKVPEPAAKASEPAQSAANDAATAEVTKALQGWAQAWSNNDVRAYLAHYANDFHTPKGESRSEWESQRKARIAGKKIDVQVKVQKVAFSDAAHATATFRQNYNSPSFKASSMKTLVLVKRGDRWLIQKESVGGGG